MLLPEDGQHDTAVASAQQCLDGRLFADGMRQYFWVTGWGVMAFMMQHAPGHQCQGPNNSPPVKPLVGPQEKQRSCQQQERCCCRKTIVRPARAKCKQSCLIACSRSSVSCACSSPASSAATAHVPSSLHYTRLFAMYLQSSGQMLVRHVVDPAVSIDVLAGQSTADNLAGFV